jgi:integrase
MRLRRDCGDWKAQHITASQIIEYCRSRATGDAGPVTVNADLSYLGSVLRVARAVWRLDVPDVIKDARMALGLLGVIGKSQQRDRRPTQQELDRLCDYFEGNLRQAIPMHDIVKFAVATAMRLSEVVSIKWDDVDLQARTVLIRNRKHPTEKLGNNQTVPLLFESDLIVIRQPRNSDRVFPFNAQSCSRAFQRATDALNIDDLTFHDLRHEGTTRLFEAGFRIEQVALVTGHRDWSMLRRYVQLRAEDLHNVV